MGLKILFKNNVFFGIRYTKLFLAGHATRASLATFVGTAVSRNETW